MKSTYCIITFKSIHHALALEKQAKGIMDGRLIPKPSIVEAGCGMCFASTLLDETKWKQFLKTNNLNYEKIKQVIF